jgi:hypothetical protein
MLLWLAALHVLTSVGLVSAKAVTALGELGGGYCSSIVSAPDAIPGVWARWDSNYYIRLAEGGYAPFLEAAGFFPLYPMLMAGLSRITGASPVTTGMLISHLSYLAAILLFYKLARLIRDDHAYAMRCVLYMLLFPSSFFFFATYAESLSLALSILAVYLVIHARPSYVQSGLALCLAAAARPVSWVLDIVPLVEFIRRRQFSPRSLLSLAVGLALSISGVVLFVLHLYSITGTFLAIPQAQAKWQRQWELPWLTLWKSLRLALSSNNVTNDWFLYVINWSDLLFTLLALTLTALALWWSLQGSQRFSWSLSIYLFSSLAFIMSSQGLETVPLWGMTRWVAALFPIYLVLGDLSQSRIAHRTMALVSGSLLLLFTAWWTSGRWVG